VESFGMICAEDELGLGDDHEGIMVLNKTPQNLHINPIYTGDEPAIGQDFAEYMNLRDKVLDIDILPNRGHDCLNYRGIALELATLEETDFQNLEFQQKEVKNFQPKNSDNLKVEIQTSNCSRYAGAKIKNIKIKPSPQWMQARLKASGMKPINNVVDITNYVMLETGQPMHAFDKKLLQNSQIIVRQAEASEKITLLDEQELELTKDDIVITDGKKVVALAGVMGGLESGIQADTTEIILEGASFNSSSIRLTARRYNLQTDAAFRFERDIDPNFVASAMERAIELIQELADGEVESITDIYPEPVEAWEVKLNLDYVERLLGVKIKVVKVKNILKRLGIEVESQIDEKDKISKNAEIKDQKLAGENQLICTIPTRRRDLRTEEDLIEEIGRIYGYDKIQPQPIISQVQVPRRNEERFFERTLKDICVSNGFNEIKSYSFYGRQQAEAIGLGEQKHLALLNPFNAEQDYLRRTLAVHLLTADKKNLSYFDQVNLFEIGRIYNPTENSLPDEKLMFGATVASKSKDGAQFFELKGLLETVFQRIGLTDFYFTADFLAEKNEKNEQIQLPNLHPSRQAMIKTGDGKFLGWVGEVNRTTYQSFGLKKVRVAVSEIDMTTLRKEAEKERFFEPLAKFPFVTRDLSMLVTADQLVGEVERVIYLAGGELVKDVDLFDLYVNPKTGERSMAFRITFGNLERTLKSAEVDQQIAKIIKTVESELEVEVRK
jgi:phenylalanyl-tRNA synthetase beta chain